MNHDDLRFWLTTDDRDLDLFAGPGGWDEGIKPLGLRPLGIEWDGPACETGRAAGHLRLEADIAKLDPRHFLRDGRPVRRLIASPPCQGFSMAGKGEGRRDSEMLIAAIDRCDSGKEVDEAIAYLHEHMHSDKSVLVLEPLRWAFYLRPEVICLEQVPTVLPVWKATAEALQDAGYSVVTGILNAEQCGVPQTRRRAVLIARRDGKEARLPTPTHSRYYSRDPKRLDDGVLPWVSMAQALGWTDSADVTMRSNYGTGGDPAARGERTADQPAPTVTGKIGRNKWVFERPATTVQSTDRIGQPGHKHMGDCHPGEPRTRQFAEGSVRVTVAEAAVLQSFLTDYPFQGAKGKQYEQVGNAVPPLLAYHVVRAALAGGEEV